MPKYLRPSGSTIELQDTPNMKAYAESNGWTPVEDKPKRVRRTKEQIEADKQAH